MIGEIHEGPTGLVEPVQPYNEAGQPAAMVPSSVDAAVTASGICKAYLPRGKGSDPFVALENVDLTVEAGSFLTILGPSGCGKTTLLNIMAGIDSATQGSVSFADGIRRRAYMFQRDTLLPWRTAVSNVEIGMSNSGMSRAAKRAAATEWLELVGLQGFENAYPAQLSGGMRRRVALATVFAHRPEVLFMDEPFGAVDAQTRIQLQGELLKLCESKELTVIFVTHDIEESLLLSDRVVVMSGKPGRIIDDLNVAMPRPRSVEAIRFDQETVGMAQRIWEELAATPVPQA
jgi:NitT/TauT family transport system ATP-binding protein